MKITSRLFYIKAGQRNLREDRDIPHPGGYRTDSGCSACQKYCTTLLCCGTWRSKALFLFYFLFYYFFVSFFNSLSFSQFRILSELHEKRRRRRREEEERKKERKKKKGTFWDDGIIHNNVVGVFSGKVVSPALQDGEETGGVINNILTDLSLMTQISLEQHVSAEVKCLAARRKNLEKTKKDTNIGIETCSRPVSDPDMLDISVIENYVWAAAWSDVHFHYREKGEDERRKERKNRDPRVTKQKKKKKSSPVSYSW